MTDLLIAFVIPVLVVIIAAILQTIIKCSYKVAGIIFVILIIGVLAIGATLLLFGLAWLYTILAFIVATIVGRCTGNRCNMCCCRRCRRNNNEENNDIDDDDNNDCNRGNRHWSE